MPACSRPAVALLGMWLGVTAPVRADEEGARGVGVSHLVEDVSGHGQVDPDTDSDSSEAPPEFTPGPAPNGQRLWVRKFEQADVQSYFTAGKLAVAKDAFDHGAYSKTRALLEDQGDALPVRYLRAMAAFQNKNYEQAGDELLSVAAEYAPVRSVCLLHAGWAFEKAGKLASAADRFAEVPPDALQYAEARLGLSRVQARRHNVKAAIDALRPLVETGAHEGDEVRAEAWAIIARLSHDAGDPKGEQQAQWALWANEPDSSQAKALEKRVAKKPVPVSWQVARAEALVSMHLNREALKLLERLVPHLELPDPLACRAHFAYGTALRKERKHSRAIPTLRAVVEQCKAPELRPRALYVLGYSESVAQPAAAIETYRTLAREYPVHPYADDALFYRATTKSSQGDAAGALLDLGEIIERYPAGDFAAEALFRRFWSRRAAGDFVSAMEDLKHIESLQGQSATHEQVQRARYWRARVLEATAHHDEALDLLERVAAEGATTYYGLLAQARLDEQSPERFERVMGKLAVDPGRLSVWPMDAGSMAFDPRFQSGIELLRLQDRGAAAELLAVKRRGKSEESVRLLFHSLRMYGLERSARVLAKSLLREGLSGRTLAEARILYESAFPHSFRELVEQHAKAAQVDPDLMQALIREESAFNPRARSSTGALGLAQLMPTTARRVARALKGPRFTARSLFDPKQNIRLGSAYLGELHRQFEGNAVHAVASYNAGPAAVSRWLKNLPDAEVDEWVEQIPVEETRDYVKRVLGSYATYQLLYEEGEKPAKLKLSGTERAAFTPPSSL